MSAILALRRGDKFGFWTLLSEPKKNPGSKYYTVEAQCKCSLIKTVDVYTLIKGNSRSCQSCALTRHGATKQRKRSPEFIAWDNMLQRCYNPKNCNYKRYGARGITVCDRWNPKAGGSFENFLADLGPKPDPSYQLDKEAITNSSLAYDPDTTRWVSKADNNRHKRNNRLLTCGGITLTVAEWVDLRGLTRSALNNRLARGWSIERALTTPLMR